MHGMGNNYSNVSTLSKEQSEFIISAIHAQDEVLIHADGSARVIPDHTMCLPWFGRTDIYSVHDREMAAARSHFETIKYALQCSYTVHVLSNYTVVYRPPYEAMFVARILQCNTSRPMIQYTKQA
jgi:hypothetical protein